MITLIDFEQLLEAAYCAQDPWLPNLTVRETIVGNSDFDDEWYMKILHCCALEPDISHWAGADSTLIGTGGVSLSAGQKQRIALARALYSRKPCLVLDDLSFAC